MVQTMRLDEIIDAIDKHPELYREGKNLTPDQKKVIKPEDTWEVAFINDIPEEVVKILNRAFVFPDMGHYYRFQREEWGNTQKRLLRAKLRREPTSLELIEDSKKNRNFERYRLCYVINFPENVAIDEEKYPACEDIVGWFLAEACRLNPKNAGNLKPEIDYFDIIERNTISMSEQTAVSSKS